MACIALASCLVLGCDSNAEPGRDGGPGGAEDAQVSPGLGPPASAYVTPPDTLDGWNLFADAPTQTPGARTVAYEVIAPLFSDYTAKHRFIYVPEGAVIAYDPAERWQLPEGSVLIKTFSYPHDQRDPGAGGRLLETRLLVVTAQGVVPHTYVWNDEQTQATRKVAGTTLASTWLHFDGAERTNDYRVPNTNQCQDCHGKPEVARALGIRTRQLDRLFDYGSGAENQIDHMQALGLFDRAPEPEATRQRLVDPFGDAALSDRARSYLDANCAQCHTKGGDASASGMWLDWQYTAPEQDPATWGVCKRPTSAAGASCGNEVDIVPGQPDRSIYMCRVESTDPTIQMPPLGRNLLHAEGAALLRTWISQLEGACE